MNPVCKSDGCRSETAFKLPDQRGRRPPAGAPPPLPNGGNRIYSKYCLKHTCQFFYEPEGCIYKKPHYDMVCASHAQCPIPGCIQCKGQFLDNSNPDSSGGIRYLRQPFCPEHTCTVPQCAARRAQPHPAGPFLPFCPQHRCAIENCKKQRINPRNFCQEHKCKDPECQTIVEEGFELCTRHNACLIRSCNKPRHKIPKGKELLARDLQTYDIEEYGKSQFLPYCQEHGSCETTGCQGFGTPTSRHCPKHTCPERDCKISTANHHYCDTHRCESQSCESPKGWKKNLKDREKFCTLHMCRKKDCQGDVPNMHMFCTKHECSKPNCISDVVAEALCLVHIKQQYQSEAKAKAKAEMEEWMRLAGRNDDTPPPFQGPSERHSTQF